LPALVLAVEVEPEVEVHVGVVGGHLRLGGRSLCRRPGEQIEERRIDVHRVDRRGAVAPGADWLRGLKDRHRAVAWAGYLLHALVRRVAI
jgi:hypothetical protein